jgi:two-component system, OmpR family, sensor histidine kinase ArlS
MTIRTKMTLLFVGIVSLIFVIFCYIIYDRSEVYRQNEYEARLRQEALTAATVLFSKEVDKAELLKLMAKNQMTVLDQENIQIYDKNNQIIYQSGQSNSTLSLQNLNKIRQNKEYFWEENELEHFGLVFKNKATEYVVFATAIDKYGLSKQKNLATMLIIGGLIMLALSGIIGYLFAGGLLNPLNKIIQKIDSITLKKLNQKLPEGNKSDELAQLAIRFNQMLDRLQHSFRLQKAFVSHASHELRTPLTAITGQIQVSILANDNHEDLKLMIYSVLEDVQQLNKLTNNLLDLTSIDTDDLQMAQESLNIEVLVKKAIKELEVKHPLYQFNYTPLEISEIVPIIKGNTNLLYTAFLNLAENGAKFSFNNTVNIELFVKNNGFKLVFQNNGQPIAEKDMEQIFEPFKRGANSRGIKGHGVGLSLTKRIIELHQGKITLESDEFDGTVFTVFLNK